MFDKREYDKRYRKEHKEKIDKRAKECNKRYIENNRELVRSKSKRYLQTASGVYSGIKGGLKKVNKLDRLEISRDDFITWYDSQKKICFYCKRTSEESAKDYQYKKNPPRLSIDRIDNKKGYEKGNITLACRRCNNIKNDFFTKDEMLKIVETFPYKFCR